MAILRPYPALCETPSASRRSVLLAGGALFGASYLPKLAHAADGRDPRLIVIILRGALDGLSAVAPLGDPDYAALHGAIALTKDGEHAARPLDGFFGLNPGMPAFERLFKARQAAIIHAVASPYRERSHFDGQDVLESGQAGPGRTQTGWLNRAIEALPRSQRASRSGLAVGAVAPLVMRGSAPVTGWAPTNLPQAEGDLATRLIDLYRTQDPRLGEALTQGLGIDKIAGRDMGKPVPGGGEAGQMKAIAEGAARIIAADEGPRVAALAFDGWDTHANEGGATGRLAMLLSGLDAAFAAFEQGLGDKWKSTAIVAVTEFGRTARINGTTGTDHGTGTVAFLAGGAVAGGRVHADWPGLRQAQLWQDRDLRPTTDLRAVLKGLLADHLGLGDTALSDKVFPDSRAVRPLKGLISA